MIPQRPVHQRRCRLLPLCGLLVCISGCADKFTQLPGKDGQVVRFTEVFNALVDDPLSLDAARRAHQEHEQRRHRRLEEAMDPGRLLRTTAKMVEQTRIDRGEVSLGELHEVGRRLFEHEFAFVDGLGSGQNKLLAVNPFRRVHSGRSGGPETTSCTSCHWRGGSAGAGALQDNSFFLGDGDRISSADARNPPPLHGVGVVQALAAEMSTELQSQRDQLVARSRQERQPVTAQLSAKGVAFGVLLAQPNGTIETSGLDGVDSDLVVKPLGWKGTFSSLRDFVEESLQVHFGIQSEDLLTRHGRRPDGDLLGHGKEAFDPDEDGIGPELTSGQLTALTAFLAMQEVPIIRLHRTLHDVPPLAEPLVAPTPTEFFDEWAKGQRILGEIGCTTCHVPRLVLKEPFFRTHSSVTGGTLEIDLSRQGETPRIRHDAALDGYPVWLYSDLKRHDLGSENASRHVDHGVARERYLTRPLWGLASSAPYFYDGRAPWFDHAIAAHGGEAAPARAAFEALSFEEKSALRIFLMSLTRTRRLLVP